MIYIGIDPGVNTGFAVWDADIRAFREVCTYGIVEALHEAREWAELCNATLVIEDARQRQWLPRERNLSEYRGKLMGAGSVRRDSQIWEEFADFYNIPIILQPPRKGATKWTAEQFKRITGWPGRTSNHARDAALLVWER